MTPATFARTGHHRLGRAALLALPALIGLSLNTPAAFAGDSLLKNNPIISPATEKTTAGESKFNEIKALEEKFTYIASATPKAGSEGNRPGDLDPSINGFHTGEPGIRRIHIDQGYTKNDKALAVMERSDGKIYVVGQAGVPSNENNNIRKALLAIKRLREDGSDDASFGNNGLQLIDTENDKVRFIKAEGVTWGGYDYFYILAAGDLLNDGLEVGLLACYRAPQNGNTFEACPGFFGFTSVDVFLSEGDCSAERYNELLIDKTNQKIYVAGRGGVGEPWGSCKYGFGVTRMNMDGTMDTSFNNGGIRAVLIPPVTAGSSGISTASAHAIALQPDGKIVLGGSSTTDDEERAVIVQLTPSGSLDGDFCPPSASNCDSPSTHRSGIKAWAGDSFSRVAALAPANDSRKTMFVLRNYRTAGSTHTRAVMGRMDIRGECSGDHCTERALYAPSGNFRITTPVSMIYHPTPEQSTMGHIVVASVYTTVFPVGMNTVVHRVRVSSGGTLGTDDQFTTDSPTQRQLITFPAYTGVMRVSTPSMIRMDRKGRYLIVGTAAYNPDNDNDYDFSFARLRGINPEIFEDGFESR